MLEGRNKKVSLAAFTLIEIMIVVIILGVLTTLVIPQYSKIMERSRQSEAYTSLGVIRGAQVRYYAEYADYVYGTVWSKLDIEQPTGKCFSYGLPTGQGWTSTCVARGTRDATYQNSGYGTYTMDIAPDGTITRTAEAGKSTPP